jgi:DNA-binding Lrp family transcriptional regulator
LTSEIDNLDASLIATLRANPRVGLLEVARRLGVARGTVQARLAKLERTGVITGHGPEVEPSKLGYGVAAFVMIELAQGMLREAVEVMEAMPELLEADGVSGPQDLICRVVARDTEHLQQLVNELLRTPAIRRCTSYIVLSRQVPPRTLPLVISAGGGGIRPGEAGTRPPRPASGSARRASRESARRGPTRSSRP